MRHKKLWSIGKKWIWDASFSYREGRYSFRPSDKYFQELGTKSGGYVAACCQRFAWLRALQCHTEEEYGAGEEAGAVWPWAIGSAADAAMLVSGLWLLAWGSSTRR